MSKYSENEIQALESTIEEIAKHKVEIQQLTDQELKNKTLEFKARFNKRQAEILTANKAVKKVKKH
jgi:preprotein translocase subunit SecA